MEASEVKCTKLNKINILHRASLRGLKKCKSCGAISGQRAFICRNDNCDLRKRMLAAITPFGPIQLITGNDLRLFSLKTRDKHANVRNFVRITTATSNAEVQFGYPTKGGPASSTAECYVDSCKYDPSAMAATGCRHVKACRVANNIPQAEVYPLDMNVLWNLNITETQKQKLWELYEHDKQNVHPIQRLDASTFVVACDKTKNFAAGRLHVTVFANCIANKKGFYACACKKLKIVVEADNSVIMKKEICDHILLVVAAILNKSDGKTLYGDFLESLQYLWMPDSLNLAVESTSDIMDFDLPLIKCEPIQPKKEVNESPNTEDLFRFSEELFTENSIPDFSDIILDVHTGNVPSTNSQLKRQDDNTGPTLHIKDPQLNASHDTNNDDDFDFKFSHIEIPEPGSTSPIQVPINFNENSLSVIEQFQLNDNIQISNDNIALAKDIESLNDLESEVSQFAAVPQTLSLKAESLLKTQQKPEQMLNTNTSSINSVIVKPTCKKVFVNKSVIVKQSPVKIIKITTPGVIQKLPQIDKKFVQISKIDSSKIIVLNQKNSERRPFSIQPINSLSVTSTVPSPPMPEEYHQSASTPSLPYESWLDHIIEILNDSIILQDSNNIKHTFHVHEDMFSHFSTTFGFNNKRRLPNTTTLIKNGKHKGLIKHAWYFNQAAAVTRIFSTKNSKLELQRSSEPMKDGSFVPFFTKLSNEITVTQLRPIQPKVPENRVFLKFSNAPESAMDKHEERCGDMAHATVFTLITICTGLRSLKFNSISTKQRGSMSPLTASAASSRAQYNTLP